MIETLDLSVSLLFECLILIYYTNSIMRPKQSYILSNAGIILGYILLYIISLYNIPFLNAAAFIIANFIIIYLGFKTKLKNAIIQILILTAIMMVSEFALSMMTNIGAEVNGLKGVEFSTKMIHAVLSKMLYFFGIVIVKFLSADKSEYENTNGFLSLITIPIFTILSIIGAMSVLQYIDERHRIIFTVISAFGVIANIIVYWMYDKTLQYHKEIQELQVQQYKNNLELTYCNMLEEKLSQAKIMRHDFKEHLEVLKQYIGSDNTNAKEYLKSIEIKNEEINIVNYTNNKVLNILLSEKHKICVNKGIEFKIHASDVNLDFIKDIDIVSIFSNLLNNAIESCEKSGRKFIYVNLYKMNSAFLVIKIENGCDERPVENDGFYKTTKISDGEHGIGLKSVVTAIKEYSGDLRMEYNSEEKVFSVVIMISLIE